MPFAKIALCMVDKTREKELEDVDKENDFQVQEIKIEQIADFKSKVEHCIDTEDYEQEQCSSLCKQKTLSEYRFPVDIFSALRKAFRIIFQAFTEKDADEFYMNYNGKTLNQMVDDNQVSFFLPENSKALDEMEIKIAFEGGVILNNNPISKKFTVKPKHVEIGRVFIGLILGLLF